MTDTKTTTATDLNLNATTTGTDLVAVERKALDRLNKSAAKDDLDDFLRGSRRSLLLLDASSSMEDTGKDGMRRIDALRQIVRDLKKERTFPMAAFGRFLDHVGNFTTVRIVE